MILGIDEAGRGPWAGPLVVGAVVLGGIQIDGLTDSKKLSKKKREQLYDEIIQRAPAYGSGWVSSRELDEVGMSAALRLATRRAVEKISIPYSEIIIDGTINFLAGTGKGAYVKTLTKADLLIPSVSAASIIAKVERDRYMATLETVYPGYGFSANAGYGVAKHREAIKQLGVIAEHRLSFAPLQQYSTHEPFHHQERGRPAIPHISSTKHQGDAAENAVTHYLELKGHTILERNWRTKLCEIDIVSRGGDTIYFIEVKYRSSDSTGDGLAVITPKKQKQMQFAAHLYSHSKRLKDTNLQLVAVATTGTPPHVTNYIEIT